MSNFILNHNLKNNFMNNFILMNNVKNNFMGNFILKNNFKNNFKSNWNILPNYRGLFFPNFAKEFSSLAVWWTLPSRHNEGPIDGPPYNLSYVITMMFEGFQGGGLMMPRGASQIEDYEITTFWKKYFTHKNLNYDLTTFCTKLFLKYRLANYDSVFLLSLNY